MFNLSIFAIRNFREEDCILSLSVEIFLISWVLEIVHSRPRIFLRRKIVILHLVRLKNFSLDFA